MSEYHVKFETLSIGGIDVQIRSLKDTQQFSDPDKISEKAGISSATWSLFGVIWPSSIILADAMHRHPIKDIKILEIGCGLALASMIACRRGADITASDYHPLAGSFLEKNVKLNEFPQLNFKMSDWSKPNDLLGTFDLIIGSDVLYERNHPEILSGFIDIHSNKKVKVIIVDPGRRQQSAFTNKMLGLGYSVNSDKVNTELSEDIQFKGKILTYLR